MRIVEKNPAFKPKQAELDNRKFGRIDIRANEGVKAKLSLDHGKDSFDVEVYDLSIHGMSIKLDLLKSEKLIVLEFVSIDITFTWGENFSGKYCVCWKQSEPNSCRVGLRAMNETYSVPQTNTLPSATYALVQVPSEFPIFGFIYKDYFYNEKSAVKLDQVSIDSARVSVFDTEVIFFRGMEVEIIFSLQTTARKPMKGKILDVRTKDKSVIELDLKLTSFPNDTRSGVINHLIQNSDVTLEEIRSAGFVLKDISNNLKFRFVRTHEEYLSVLALRHRAYSLVGKINTNVKIEDMVAPLDHKSRILVAYHRNRIVASAAMSFPDSEDIMLDTERPFESGFYRSKIPSKTKIIEISRLCTHEKYRRGDLLLRVFEHIYRVFISSGREYLVSSSDETLWPLYKKLGFKKIGLEYAHPSLNNVIHNVIIIHKSKGTSASGIGLFRWNYLYRDMTIFLDSREQIHNSLFSRIRLKIFTLIGLALGIRIQTRY